MKYKITCKDMGMGDDFEAEGKTMAETMDKMKKHAKSYHKLTEMEIKDPRMEKIMREKIWRRKNNK